MKPYDIRFTKEAKKDVSKLSPKLKKKLQTILIERISVAPHSEKRLVGELKEFYSARLSYKDRILYTIDEKAHIVFIHRARTHYGD